MSKKIIRVFPRRTNATPTDELAVCRPPDLFDEADEVHISVTFTYDREDDVPCPMCRRAEAVKWHAGQMGCGTYKERMAAARHLVADIINNRKYGKFPLPTT